MSVPTLEQSLDVMESYQFAGRQVSGVEESLLVLDPMLRGCPIVGASCGFERLTGRPVQELLGKDFGSLSAGVPNEWLSQSSTKNLASFCRSCSEPDLVQIAEAAVVQPQSRKDGSVYMSLSFHSFCVVPCPGGLRRYVISVVTSFAEGGLERLHKQKRLQMEEEARAAVAEAKLKLDALSVLAGHGMNVCAEKYNAQKTPFGFFTRRLEGPVKIMNAGYTVERREFEEIPTGCIVFGDRPVQECSKGLSFCVRVDSITEKFSGMPFLGFSKQRPATGSGSSVMLSKCLPESVVVGGNGEGFARDKKTSYKMGFKAPPATEIESWSLPCHPQYHRLDPPTSICSGDELECRYTWQGRIQFIQNGSTLMDFDTGRPLDPEASYYAVVDVCFSAARLSLLSEARLASKVMTQSTMCTMTSSVGDSSTKNMDDESSSSSSSSSSRCSLSDVEEEWDALSDVSISAEQIMYRAYRVGMFGAGIIL